MPYFANSVPVTLLTGFLGSGKTTLLSTLLKSPELSRTAVIINEFGEVGLDHSLMEHSDDKIVELQSGCICCTIQNDLRKTLKNLIRRRYRGGGLERVVIETTGLADPVPIIHTLMTAPDLVAAYQLETVITLVDAVNGSSTLDLHTEAVKQAAMAEKLVISKTDLMDGEAVGELVRRLQALNPAASIFCGQPTETGAPSFLTGGGYDPFNRSEDARNWLQAELYTANEYAHHHDHNLNRHGDNIHAFALTHDQPIRRFAFEMFLDMLTMSLGPKLLRTKGIVNVLGEDSPAVIHGVQQIFHPVRWLDRWPDSDHRTRIVFITVGTPKEEVEHFFRILIDAAERVLGEMKDEPKRRRGFRRKSVTA